MLENLQNLALTLILAVLCGTLGWLIRINKQRVLEYTAQLIQKVEIAIQGSGMGEKKKQVVIAQLEAAGVRVTSWLSVQIDTIVATLNSKGAWLAEQVKESTVGLENATNPDSSKEVTTNGNG